MFSQSKQEEVVLEEVCMSCSQFIQRLVHMVDKEGKEKVHSAQGRRVQHNAAATCERGPEVLTQTMFIGYAAKRLGMRSMVN